MKKLIYVLAVVAMCSCSAIAGEAEEMMATFINLNGHLCARVVNINKLRLPNTYEVRCVEYRGGTGTVDYIVNVKSGEVIKR